MNFFGGGGRNQGGGGMGHNPPAANSIFIRQFKAYSPAFIGKPEVNNGNKIILPSSALAELARLKISYKDIAGLILLIGLPRKLTDISIIFKVLISFVTKSRSSLASYFDYFFLYHSYKID